jgi:hypothetical protein
MRIRSYTFGKFVSRVTSFHGFEAVGVIIGEVMVDRHTGTCPMKDFSKKSIAHPTSREQYNT